MEEVQVQLHHSCLRHQMQDTISFTPRPLNPGGRVSDTDWIGAILERKNKFLTLAGIGILIPCSNSP
jgi:hypothetical protein